jgi:glutamine cyclotransferase
MRYLFFFSLILVLLLGCQAISQQPYLEGGLTPVSESINLPLANASPSPVQPTATKLASDLEKGSARPIQLATQSSEPVTTPTQEKLPVNPVRPSPTVQITDYPVEQVTQVVEPTWHYRVINEFPHDSSAYTQGLVIETDLRTLLEGTGRDSSLRRVDLQTGTVVQYYALPDTYFGEGITLFEDKIYQLTWRGEIGFIYNNENFEQIGEFYYPHQGWGLTHDGRNLIVSDGTEVIRFWDPATFEEIRRITVISANGPVTQLNELEYVNGEIWANVWHTDLIVRISPKDGRVLGWIDLTGLLDPQLRPDPEAVLNGIAYSEESGRLFVTGKYWPTLFELEILN